MTAIKEWYALSQERSVKGTDKASPELLGSFSGRLLADPPKDREELKVLLSEHFPLGAQKNKHLGIAGPSCKTSLIKSYC